MVCTYKAFSYSWWPLKVFYSIFCHSFSFFRWEPDSCRAIWGSVSCPRTLRHAEWGRLGSNRQPSWMSILLYIVLFIDKKQNENTKTRSLFLRLSWFSLIFHICCSQPRAFPSKWRCRSSGQYTFAYKNKIIRANNFWKHLTADILSNQCSNRSK